MQGSDFLLAASLVWAALIFWFSVFQAPSSGGSGIALHFTAYLFLSFLVIHASQHKKRLWLAVAGATGYGILLEVLQGFVGRYASAYDMLANAIGAVSAAAVYKSVAAAAQCNNKRLKKHTNL